MSWLTDYLEFTKRQESPQIFHFWNAIGTVAGVVGRKVWLPRVSDGIERYRIYPGQIMLVLVAGSGRLRKSTSLKLPNALFKASGVKVLDGATSPEKLLSLLGGTGPHTKQATLTILAPELSVFLSKQNYATHLVNILNDLADAPDKKDFPTQGRGDVWVQNACVTLLAATTPVDLAESIPPSALQRGFSSRIIFVFASKTDRIEALEDDQENPQLAAAALQARDRLVNGVQVFASLAGPMSFTDDGRDGIRTWYHKFWGTNDEESEGWSARRHDHMLRVAMCFQICKNQSMFLEVDSLKRADAALKIVEEGLPEVFAYVGIHNATSSGIDRMLAVFKKHGGQLTNWELMEKCLRYFPDQRGLNDMLYSLQKIGWVEKVGPLEVKTGTQTFQLVPIALRHNGAPKSR